jgi:hypothetical protein
LVELEKYIHSRIPPAGIAICSLEGAPPLAKAGQEEEATIRYEDCLEKKLKRLGAEIQ